MIRITYQNLENRVFTITAQRLNRPTHAVFINYPDRTVYCSCNSFYYRRACPHVDESLEYLLKHRKLSRKQIRELQPFRGGQKV